MTNRGSMPMVASNCRLAGPGNESGTPLRPSTTARSSTQRLSTGAKSLRRAKRPTTETTLVPRHAGWSTAARTFTSCDPCPGRCPHEVDDLDWPGVALDGDFITQLDRPRHQRHAEVVGGEVVEHADGDPGQHHDSMT